MSSLGTSVESTGSAPGSVNRGMRLPSADGDLIRHDPIFGCLVRILKSSEENQERILKSSEANQRRILKHSFDLAVRVEESLYDADYERAKDYDRLSDLNTMDVADWKSRYEELLQERREQVKAVSGLTVSEQDPGPETEVQEADAGSEQNGDETGDSGELEPGADPDMPQNERSPGQGMDGMYEQYSIHTYRRKKELRSRGNLRKIAVQFVKKELEELLNKYTDPGSFPRDLTGVGTSSASAPEYGNADGYEGGIATGPEMEQLACKLLFKLCSDKRLSSLLRKTIADRNADPEANGKYIRLRQFLLSNLQHKSILTVFVKLFSGDFQGEKLTVTPEYIAEVISVLNSRFAPVGDRETLSRETPRRFQFVYLLKCRLFFSFLNRFFSKTDGDPIMAAKLLKTCCQEIMESSGMSWDDFLDQPLFWTNCQYYEELIRELEGGKDKGLAVTISFRDVLTAVMLFLGGEAATPFFTREDLVASLWDSSNGDGIEPDCLFDLPFYKKRITEFKSSVTRAQQEHQRSVHAYSRFLLNFYCVFLARGSSSPYIPTGHEFYPCLVKTYACHLLECIIRRVWGSAGEGVIRKVLEELVEQVFASPVARVILELTPAMRLNLGSVHIMTQKSRRNAMLLLWQDRGVVQSFTICLDLMAGGLKLLRSGETDPTYLRILPEPGAETEADSVTEADSESESGSGSETRSTQGSEHENGNDPSSEREPETDPVTSPGPETAA